MNDLAIDNKHCQACLMPMGKFAGVSLHPSAPGWRNCQFRYMNHVRQFLVLASLGEDVGFVTPAGFPISGPCDAVAWAIQSQPASPPNIVFFVAGMLGIPVI